MTDLRDRLDLLLRDGFTEEPIAHAEQVARIATVLCEAFDRVGMRATMVGGSAIAVLAPGVHVTRDIDLVVEWPGHVNFRERLGPVFEALGFVSAGRHWQRGELFVEVPGSHLEGRAELIQAPGIRCRVASRETVLRDRIVGFKQWRHTGQGLQAIELLRVFSGELDLDWLRIELMREGSWDAFEPLVQLAEGKAVVDDEGLRSLLRQLEGI